MRFADMLRTQYSLLGPSLRWMLDQCAHYLFTPDTVPPKSMSPGLYTPWGLDEQCSSLHHKICIQNIPERSATRVCCPCERRLPHMAIRIASIP